MQTFRMDRTSQRMDQKNMIFPDVESFVKTFCEDSTKGRNISKVLVATNGIAAVKCILSIRKLLMQLFKDDRIIKFICLTTEQEIQSKAEYLKMADNIVFSPVGANTNNYANVEEIVGHAVRCNVDAVWAGWGHASENPKLPEELNHRGIIFIGPPANAMFALGDKIASTIIAQTVNIPTIEWSGSGICVPTLKSSSEITIPDSVYNEATVSTVEEGLKCLKIKNISYPVMIKASEGGGGKGIRKCANEQEFILNFRRVQAEVPGSPIFLMKCMENARHIEVQLIADQYGQVIPIFTRDCSIQRRCQKIIEEAPAGIAPSEILRSMQQDAVNLAKIVGYVSAGTVEYMYLPDTQKYYFLELNPRLQVEHPCTEMISNINIPAIQLQIAMGIPLHRIVEIRTFFGLDRYGTSSLPENQIRTDTNICVIAARITSEDPAEGFRPASGSVSYLNFQSNQNVWGYFSVSSSGKVHEFADSQFGHLFAKGTTRHEAISALMCALKELELRATFQSQIHYLVGLLRDPVFENNTFHTGWLDERIAAKVQSAPEHPLHTTIAIGATVIGHARISEVFGKFRSAIERGQILPTSELTETWQLELVHNNIKYSVLVNRYGLSNFLVNINNNVAHTCVHQYDNGGGLLVSYADQSFQCFLDEEQERFKVTIGQTMTIFEKENDPSVLRSRNAGRLLQYLKKDGEKIEVGDIYAEMESMKMVINLDVKKAGGILVQRARPGQVLFPGTLIAELTNQGDMSAARPVIFNGKFEEWFEAEKHEKQLEVSARLNSKFESVIQSCTNILAGYAVPEHMFTNYIKDLVDKLYDILDNDKLPFDLYKVVLNVVKSRIKSNETYDQISALLDNYDEFPAAKLSDTMSTYLDSINPADVGMERTYFEKLQNICDRFDEGLEGHKRIIVKELIELFLTTEKCFQDVSYDRGVAEISSQKEHDIDERVRMVYSHTRIQVKNMLLEEIIGRLNDKSIETLQPILKILANLFNAENEKLAVFVCKILMKVNQTSYGQLCSNVSRKSSRKNLNELVNDCSGLDGDSVLKNLVVNGAAELRTLLHEFFFTSNPATNSLAVKHFIKSAFHIHENEVETLPHTNTDATFFKFVIRPTTPLYETSTKEVVYFLSVLNKLDLLRRKEIMVFLKDHAHPDAHNIFLFVAFPTGENGFSQAINLPEEELRKLGRELREEVFKELAKHDIAVHGVDLMISSPSNPPIYTQFDFSAKMKLELDRLPKDSRNVSTQNSPFLLFKCDDNGIKRLFVRHLMRDIGATIHVEQYSKSTAITKFRSKLIDVIDGACGEIRVHSHGDKTGVHDCNHILIRIDYDPTLNTDDWPSAIKEALCYYEKCFIKLHVTEVEIIYQANKQNNVVMYRVLYNNETGTYMEIAVYRIVNGEMIAIGDGPFRYNGLKVDIHRPITNIAIQKRRIMAHKLSTTYCYDLPIIFGKAILDLWHEYQKSNPKSFETTKNKLPVNQREALSRQDPSHFCQAHELVLKEENGPITVISDPNELRNRVELTANDRGMVAWKLKLYSPDCPSGREIVLIANDVTYQMGSFSMKEHRLYYHASVYSRKNKLPRVYVAANSGARIGFAADIKNNFNVLWNQLDHPEEGFEALYLEEAASKNPEILKQIDGCNRDGKMIINAVIGKEDDIGVENLVGSGLIAGETSAAYQEVPTYCLVTGRAVGIGAYAARLSHRIVQVEPSHLILTGAPALNSLLGREIYTSNGQLGGTQIMHKNGVSHAVAQSDLEGVTKVIRWISYLPQTMPKIETEPHVLMPLLTDDIERRVTVAAPKGQYDPRDILDPKNGGGLFDANSLDEIMDGWAKTIISARARLCGIPVGVVAIETRTMSFEIPADPAAENSQSIVVSQAGQVWYPDSAYKTAEAINDFNREGLPLIFLANIRGFSGGQKDMFEMVLKFGAQIVDALQSYKQPVIVYIPPNGELRGGAWAVLDTKINPTAITMLADVESRGGVLEPEGMVEIKFRKPDLLNLMSKCDSGIQKLTQKLASAATETEKNEVKKQLQQRQEFLLPFYRTTAVKFADLHDTSTRMLAKGAIHDQLSWNNARNYIHQLLQVQLIRLDMARRFAIASGAQTPLNIQDLEAGCRWVDKYLTENECAYMSKAEHSEGGKSRFTYNVAQINEKAHGFSRVLEQVITKNAINTFIQKLGQLDSQNRSSALNRFVQSTDEETRQELLQSLLLINTPELS